MLQNVWSVLVSPAHVHAYYMRVKPAKYAERDRVMLPGIHCLIQKSVENFGTGSKYGKHR